MSKPQISLVSYLDGKYSKQQVFNFVYDKMLAQKKPCFFEVSGILGKTRFHAAYAGKDGLRCPIGHLLNQTTMNELKSAISSKSDDIALENLFGEYILNISKLDDLLRWLDRIDFIDYNNLKFLEDLQTAHDKALKPFKDGVVNNKQFMGKYITNMEALRNKWKLD